MTRILMLASDLSGNAAYTPWQFGEAMRGGGHQVALAGPRSGDLWPPLARELAEATVLPGRWAGLPRAVAAKDLSRSLGAELVYAFKALPTSLGVGLRIRAATGSPLLLHLDDWDAGFFAGVGALRRLARGLRHLAHPEGDLWLRAAERLTGRADAVTVSSSALQRRFGGRIVRQGLDVDRYTPEAFPRAEARRRLGIQAHAPMVLFLGTPRLHKGLGSLGDAPDLRRALWFVGAAPDALRAAGVPDTLLADATVRGPVPFAEAPWYLAACDVFVAPQSDTVFAHHQLPAKLVQAMALGCAVVATEVGDAHTLLGGAPAAGVLVPADDPHAIASAVRELLADRARAGRLGVEARRRAVEQLGHDSMRRAVEAVLREVGVDA